jgi:murein DD-endopeptidase MepM/ murein hydrolase activator NlpD
MRRRTRHGWIVPALVLCFYVGIGTGWWLRGRTKMPAPQIAAVPEDLPIPTSGGPADSRPDRTDAFGVPSAPDAGSGGDLAAATTRLVADPIAELRGLRLRVPIDGMRTESMKGGFAERRGGGARPHEAIDILAPRHTPVHAVEDGTIARLFTSKAGGLTIYQFDPKERFCFYYAHLDRYADGLREGQDVRAGDTIGFVGTSGNAPPSTPHLHFAIFELTPDRHWWEGRAVDPYLVFREAE